MARKPRPYVPKVKGCYQCSQRRIDCDGTRPSCLKCNARGFTCSGFEFTYRFIDGLAPTDRRRRRRPRNGSDPEPGWNSPGWNSPARFSSTETVDQNAKLTSNLPNHLEAYTPASPTSSQGSYSSPGSLSVPDLTPAFETIQSWNDDPPFCLDGGGSFQGEQGLETVEHPPLLDLTPNYDKLIDRTAQLPIHGLGCIAPWKEFLLDYFSINIAPEMVVVDDDHNGWRSLILPVAWSDDLVMDAVLAASAFHLAGRSPDTQIINPAKFYQQAICGLQLKKDLTECDRQARQSVITTIIVLLVTVMVNGYSDFPIMFNMLKAAIDAVGGESGLQDGGETAEFALRQIRKMRVYAAPLLSRDEGIRAVVDRSQESFDCLYYYSKLYPAYRTTFFYIAGLRRMAFEMYTEGVLGGGNSESAPLIDGFMRALEKFPEGSPFEHVLVWPVFIAASESNTPQHQAFFKSFLERQYRRNGFVNIPRALALLRRIWTRESTEDWTALLPEPKVFIM